MENRSLLSARLENLSIFLLGIFLLLFPIIIVSVTTDAYVIPKQAILAVTVIIGIVLLGAKGLIMRAVRIRRTPFDLPIALFGLAVFLSAIFAVNKFDSLISFVPFLFAVLLFFLITNNARREKDFIFLNSALIVGAIILSVVTLLSYLKIYPLPFVFAKNQAFTPLGSLFDQAMYLIVVLSLCLFMAWPALKKRSVEKNRLIFVVGALFVLIGTAVTVIGVITIQKPTILPYQIGFQTAFAAISQDTGRVIQGFLMGSGIGTYLTDFTRFKPTTINLSETLWSLSFLRSSSFILEIIATTGLLGILSFLFLIYRILRSRPLFVPLIIIVVFALVLPFSFTSLVLLFVMLGLYSARQGISEGHRNRFFDVELKLVTLRKGVFALTDPGARHDSEYENLLPVGMFLVTVIFAGLVGFVSVKFLVSDYLFQQSFVAAAANNAQKTYQLQTQAINMFPQRDGFHRIFSQINLTLANNLALTIPQGTQPSAEVQQTIYQLIQQSINSGRNATTISPQTAINWQNLSSIYRSLIGFGQNADQFAAFANQQAIALDPNNPQEYINYGGIFYQLGQWDEAIRQFQIAASIKNDYANAYYNLGHALEQKGDLQNALVQYQTVRNLVATDKASLDIINNEIKAIEAKITSTPVAQGADANLGISQPQAQLPEQNPPVKIPAPRPSASPTPSPKTSPSPTGSVTP